MRFVQLASKGDEKCRQARSCSMLALLRVDEEAAAADSLLPSWQDRCSSSTSPPFSSRSATMSPDPPHSQPSRSWVSDSVLGLKVNRSLQVNAHLAVYLTHKKSSNAC